jgi:hypothetical protein
MAITVVLRPGPGANGHTLVNVPKAMNWSFWPSEATVAQYKLLYVRQSDNGPVYGVFRWEDVSGLFVPGATRVG